MKFKMIVEVELITGHEVNRQRIRQYVSEAIGCWAGGGDSEDALFAGIKEVKVTVTQRTYGDDPGAVWAPYVHPQDPLA